MKEGKLTRITGLIVYIGIVAILIARQFIGQGWNDETFCINLAYRFWTGDMPIVEDWGQAQLVGVILAPVFGMYYSLAGMEGVLLFFRFFWLGFLVLISIFAFTVIKKYYGSEKTAYVSALLVLVFCTQNKALYSYYDLAVRFLILALLLVISGDRDGRKKAYYMAGLCFALSLFCNPYLFSIYLVMAILVVGFKFAGKKDYIKELMLFTAGCITIGVPFLIFILANTDISVLVKCIGYMMNTPGREKPGVILQTAKWGWYLVKAYTIGGIVLQVGLFGYTLVSACRKKLTDKVKSLLFYSQIVLGIAYGFIQWFFMDDYCVIGIVFVPLVVLAAMCFILTESRDVRTVVLVGIAGLLTSLCYQFASDTGIYAIVTGFAVMAVWVPVIVKDFLKENGHIKGINASVVCVYALVIVQVLFLRIYAYGRTNITDWDFSVKLTQGPSKGIMEDPLVVEIYEASLQDAAYLRSIEGEKVNLLLINSPSKEYLEFEQNESPNNPWISNIEDEYHQYYFEVNPGKRPKYLYADIRSGITEDELILAGYKYQLIRCEYGHLYKMVE